MIWLGRHGLISSWRDYEDMAVGLIEDARLLMEYEDAVSKRETARMTAKEPLRGHRR